LDSNLGSIAQYFDPAHWSAANLGGTAFWTAVPQIALINVLLSGDTAVVIAMACRGLPPRQRPWGVAIGAGTATALLIIFASVIAPLLQLPYIKLIGGFALIYIAVKLLSPENPAGSSVEAPTQVWRVVRVVALADIVLSLDNIIAVAAVARGDLALLTIGVAISIPIMFAGAALIMALLDRFPVFVWAGAAMLGWIGGQTIATDPAVSGYLVGDFGARFADRAAIAAAGIGLAFVIAFGALLRRR
jgi:YjbE family integral membrane protein